MGSGPGRRIRAALMSASLAALLVAQTAAASAQSPFGGGGAGSPIVAFCAAERAPLVDLNTQYDEIQRSRIGQSVKNGAVAAAGVLLTGGLLGGVFSGAKDNGPGINSGLAVFGGNRNNAARDTAAVAIVAALSVSVVTYISLKGQSDDRRQGEPRAGRQKGSPAPPGHGFDHGAPRPVTVRDSQRGRGGRVHHSEGAPSTDARSNARSKAASNWSSNAGGRS